MIFSYPFHFQVDGKRCLLTVIGCSLLLFLPDVRAFAGVPHSERLASPLIVQSLTCEFRENPLGIDRWEPRLGWEILSRNPALRNQSQSAYEILVASAPDLLAENTADCWRSGKQRDSFNNNRLYKGLALQSGATYYWKVRIWDEAGNSSAWSLPARWTMGLLAPEDWQAGWVGDSKPQPAEDSMLYGNNPAPLFRKEFTVIKRIRKAVLYISGLGYYEASLNGRKLGDHYLDPGWTDYRKTIFYNAYDVTAYLGIGRNCLGVELGNGWFNPLPLRLWGHLNMRKYLSVGAPRFLSRLVVYYADHSEQTLVSDTTWKVREGPLVRNNVYIGSTEDGRLALRGWNRPGYDERGWRPVVLLSSPGGKLCMQQQPPVRSGKPFPAVHVQRAGEGKYLVDMGRNFGGIVRVSVNGKRGDRIRLKYGEILDREGTLNPMTSVAGQVKSKGMGGPGAPDTAWQEDDFVLGKNGRDTLLPKFTFHGFRYIEIEGYPGVLKKEAVRGIPLYADTRQAGSFRCSDALFNRIQVAAVHTFQSNLFGVQSDCPHREKLGYGGDIVATSEAFMANFNMHDFYAKTIRDYTDEAQEDGALPETAPFAGISDAGLTSTAGPIGWGTVYPQLLFQLYQYYGDRELVAEHYQTAKNWVAFLAAHATDDLIDKGLGDHESIDPKQVACSGTAFFYYNTLLLEKLAALLDRKEDVLLYQQMGERIKAAFFKKFINPSNGEVGIHTEANQSFALYFHLLPSGLDPLALGVLRDQIIHRENTHVSTGIFGTKFMLEVLSENGLSRLACSLVDQQDFPGWGYMLANGATTLWEHWAYSDNTYSHNHPMFGSVSGWFFKYIAGIRPDSGAVGYDKVIFQPAIPSHIRYSHARYRSPQGWLMANWRIESHTFHYDLDIPVNTKANIWLPASSVNDILEGGKKPDPQSIHLLAVQKGWILYGVGSGRYHFSIAHFQQVQP